MIARNSASVAPRIWRGRSSSFVSRIGQLPPRRCVQTVRKFLILGRSAILKRTRDSPNCRPSPLAYGGSCSVKTELRQPNYKQNEREKQNMKRFNYAHIVAATLLGASLIAMPRAQAQQPCQDFATSGGWITPTADTFANFGAGGGFLPGRPEDLFGYLTYLDHSTSPPMLVSAQTVVGYCQIGCPPEGCQCRRITYSDATIRIGNQVCTGLTVYVEVCDCGEPGSTDTFAICIPETSDCRTPYCAGGVLGGTPDPGGGNVQVHPPEQGCTVAVPVCTNIVACTCFLQCAVTVP